MVTFAEAALSRRTEANHRKATNRDALGLAAHSRNESVVLRQSSLYYS